MTLTDTTTVSLTSAEANLFVTFQKHFSLIQLLESIGAFNVKSGSVTIHFNALGQIGSIDKQQHYRPLIN